MKKRPNPIFHMMSWGFVSSIVLSNLYFFGMDTNSTSFLIIPDLFLSLLIGIAGSIYGYIAGFILLVLAYDSIALPFTKIHLYAKRLTVFFVLTLLSLPLPVFAFALLIILANGRFDSDIFIEFFESGNLFYCTLNHCYICLYVLLQIVIFSSCIAGVTASTDGNPKPKMKNIIA